MPSSQGARSTQCGLYTAGQFGRSIPGKKQSYNSPHTHDVAATLLVSSVVPPLDCHPFLRAVSTRQLSAAVSCEDLVWLRANPVIDSRSARILELPLTVLNIILFYCSLYSSETLYTTVQWYSCTHVLVHVYVHDSKVVVLSLFLIFPSVEILTSVLRVVLWINHDRRIVGIKRFVHDHFEFPSEVSPVLVCLCIY